MSKLVEIVITQSSMYFEEGDIYDAIQEDDGFTLSLEGLTYFVPDGEAELTGEEHEEF